jgi:hypothetical protein
MMKESVHKAEQDAREGKRVAGAQVQKKAANDHGAPRYTMERLLAKIHGDMPVDRTFENAPLVGREEI